MTLREDMQRWLTELTAAGWTLADAVQEGKRRLLERPERLAEFVRDFGDMAFYALWERQQHAPRQMYRNEPPIVDGYEHEDAVSGHRSSETHAQLAADNPPADGDQAHREAQSSFEPIGRRRIDPANVRGEGFFSTKRYLVGGNVIGIGDLTKDLCQRIGDRLVTEGRTKTREGRFLRWCYDRMRPGQRLRDVLSENALQRVYFAQINGQPIPEDIMKKWEDERAA